MIVQDGEQLYISDNKQFDIPKDGYKPAIGRVFLYYPTKAMWAEYDPRGHLMNFNQENASLEKHDFKDVQAVGWYLAKDNPDGQQAHVKWYGFEADAVLHRPEQGSVNIDMVEVPASGRGPVELVCPPGSSVVPARRGPKTSSSGTPWPCRRSLQMADCSFPACMRQFKPSTPTTAQGFGK